MGRDSKAIRRSASGGSGLGSSMLIEIGNVEAIFRYPVKSMGVEPLEAANLGWHASMVTDA